jgi:hypothetical protein
MHGKFEVQPNLCLVLWIVLNPMIVISDSLVANAFILASWQTSKKEKMGMFFFPQFLVL